MLVDCVLAALWTPSQDVLDVISNTLVEASFELFLTQKVPSTWQVSLTKPLCVHYQKVPTDAT